MYRDGESEKEGNCVLKVKTNCGILSLTVETVCVSQCCSEGYERVGLEC